LDILASGRALLLIVLANSAAWASGRVLGERWAAPLDFGYVLWDGKRLFGGHKTWRGLISGMLACAVAAPLCGSNWTVGAGFGGASLLGDALSSSIKRRLEFPPGTEIRGLDQIPEALLPLVLFASALGLGVIEVAIVLIGFLFLDLFVTRLRH
jgi:CDP-2,3-bis-(O-geranylgeranyl)-sn-glycerol synthase